MVVVAAAVVLVVAAVVVASEHLGAAWRTGRPWILLSLDCDGSSEPRAVKKWAGGCACGRPAVLGAAVPGRARPFQGAGFQASLSPLDLHALDLRLMGRNRGRRLQANLCGRSEGAASARHLLQCVDGAPSIVVFFGD